MLTRAPPTTMTAEYVSVPTPLGFDEGPYRGHVPAAAPTLRLVLQWRASAPEPRTEARRITWKGAFVILVAALLLLQPWWIPVAIPAVLAGWYGRRLPRRNLRVEIDRVDLRIITGEGRRHHRIADIVQVHVSPGAVDGALVYRVVAWKRDVGLVDLLALERLDEAEYTKDVIDSQRD